MSYIKPYDFKLLEEVIRVEDYNSFVDWKNLFNSENKLIVEVGCGNGHFLNTTAKSDKNNNYIGIDIKYKRLVRCREKQIKYNIENIKWIWGEALLSVKNLFPDNSITVILMPFPDPWPKRKHHKKRLFQKNFIDIFHAKLIKDGIFAFMTDYEEYYQESYKLIKNDDRFEILSTDKIMDYDLTASLFGDRWKKDNRSFYAFYLKKGKI